MTNPTFALEARPVKVLVSPLGGISDDRFMYYFSVLSQTAVLSMQSLTPPSDWKRSQSPFKHLDWNKGTILFEYVSYDSPGGGLSDQDAVQAMRRIYVGVGIVDYNMLTPGVNIEAQMDALLQAHQHIRVRRYFLFGYPFEASSTAPLPSVRDPTTLVVFPPHEERDGGISTVQFHCNMIMSDVGVRAIWGLELLMNQADFAKAKVGKVPSWIATTTVFDEYGENPEQKKSKKRFYGRMRKLMGDMCMQVCSPRDAADHYLAALTECKAQGDILWQAAASEGLAAAYLLMSELDLVLEEVLKESKDSDDREERIFRVVEEKANDALQSYSRQVMYSIFEVELCFKLARLYSASADAAKLSRALDYLLRALSVPGKREHIMTVKMKFKRKQALFMYLASLLCADLGNDHAAHAIARSTASLYGVSITTTAKSPLILPTTVIPGFGEPELEAHVAVTNPSLSFSSIRRVLFAHAATHASESDDPISATRYYAALLRLMAQVEAQKHKYRKLMTAPTSAIQKNRTADVFSSIVRKGDTETSMPLTKRNLSMSSMGSPLRPSSSARSTSHTSSHSQEETGSTTTDVLKLSMRKLRVPEFTLRVKSLLSGGRFAKSGEEDAVLAVLEGIPLEAQEDALQYMIQLTQRLPPAYPVDISGLPGLITLRPLSLAPHLAPRPLIELKCGSSVPSAFFFSPFEQKRTAAKQNSTQSALWCAHSMGQLVAVLRNPLAVPLNLHHVSVVTEGVSCSSYSGQLEIPANSTEMEFVLMIKPVSTGKLVIKGLQFYIFNGIHFVPTDEKGIGTMCPREISEPWEYPSKVPTTPTTPSVSKHRAKKARFAGSPDPTADVTGVHTCNIDIIAPLPEVIITPGWSAETLDICAGECRVEWLKLENLSNHPVRDVRVVVYQKLNTELEPPSAVGSPKKTFRGQMRHATPHMKQETRTEWKPASAAGTEVVAWRAAEPTEQRAVQKGETASQMRAFLQELAAVIVRGQHGIGQAAPSSRNHAFWERAIVQMTNRFPGLACVPLLGPEILFDGSDPIVLAEHSYKLVPVLFHYVPDAVSAQIELSYTSRDPESNGTLGAASGMYLDTSDSYFRKALLPIPITPCLGIFVSTISVLNSPANFTNNELVLFKQHLKSRNSTSLTSINAQVMSRYSILVVHVTNKRNIPVMLSTTPRTLSQVDNHSEARTLARDILESRTVDHNAAFAAPGALVLTSDLMTVLPPHSSRNFVTFVKRVRVSRILRDAASYSLLSSTPLYDRAVDEAIAIARDKTIEGCQLYWAMKDTTSFRCGTVPVASDALSDRDAACALLPDMGISYDIQDYVDGHVILSSRPQALTGNMREGSRHSAKSILSAEVVPKLSRGPSIDASNITQLEQLNQCSFADDEDSDSEDDTSFVSPVQPISRRMSEIIQRAAETSGGTARGSVKLVDSQRIASLEVGLSYLAPSFDQGMPGIELEIPAPPQARTPTGPQDHADDRRVEGVMQIGRFHDVKVRIRNRRPYECSAELVVLVLEEGEPQQHDSLKIDHQGLATKHVIVIGSQTRTISNLRAGEQTMHHLRLCFLQSGFYKVVPFVRFFDATELAVTRDDRLEDVPLTTFSAPLSAHTTPGRPNITMQDLLEPLESASWSFATGWWAHDSPIRVQVITGYEA